jgi:NhaP-type Na+/H+ or K+/H+ antiporter
MADDSLRDVKERVLLEGQKAYIIINAAGALTLLAFVQAIWPNGAALTLKKAALWGIVAFAGGVAIACLGYIIRHWALQKSQVSSGIYFQLATVWMPLLAILCFLTGAVLPVLGGMDALSAPPPTAAGQPPAAGQPKGVPEPPVGKKR